MREFPLRISPARDGRKPNKLGLLTNGLPTRRGLSEYPRPNGARRLRELDEPNVVPTCHRFTREQCPEHIRLQSESGIFVGVDGLEVGNAAGCVGLQILAATRSAGLARHSSGLPAPRTDR